VANPSELQECHELFNAFGLFAAALLVAGSLAVASNTTSDELSTTTPIQFVLVKRVYPHADRNTFWLDIQCDRPGLRAYATCDLRKANQGIGRFSLRQMQGESKTDVVRFSVGCQLTDFVDDAVIHKQVRDDASGKGVGGAQIRLKDAKVGEPDITKP